VSQLVADAFRLALELHGAQSRKGSGVPYITHLMAVASLVGDYGGTPEQMAAAFLHDAVEDQGGRATLDRIRAEFGDEVAGHVMACSDTDAKPKPPWNERKAAFVRHAKSVAPEAKLIIAADKLHNVRCLTTLLRAEGPAAWDKFNGGRDGTLWYHAEMVRALATDWPHPILADLADAMDIFHRLALAQD